MAKRKKPASAGQTIGGILAGFDQQVFRTTPPPHELVKLGDRLPSVPSEGGGTLSIELPDDASPAAPPRDDDTP